MSVSLTRLGLSSVPSAALTEATEGMALLLTTVIGAMVAALRSNGATVKGDVVANWPA